jgi:hypothetical protein
MAATGSVTITCPACSQQFSAALHLGSRPRTTTHEPLKVTVEVNPDDIRRHLDEHHPTD